MPVYGVEQRLCELGTHLATAKLRMCETLLGSRSQGRRKKLQELKRLAQILVPM